MKEYLSYYFLRLLTLPFAYLPYRYIHLLGKALGSLAFYLLKKIRKKTLSNLALAHDLNLSTLELKKIGKKSFQNLAINLLEYSKLNRDINLAKVVKCENPQIADQLYQQGRGIIFFCGHQSNWEVLFLDGTSRMRGVAIGRPIKNKILYKWIVKIREKNGGKIITPSNALKEGLKSLRQGFFLGIVGDQGMPDSNYSFPFLGRRAWTSTAPALLSYRTNSPIIVATTTRTKGRYYIHYSNPIWPDIDTPMEKEVVNLMNKSLTLLQESIKKKPEEWLWQHNRWKQQLPNILIKKYRQDSICIILPPDRQNFDKFSSSLPSLKKLYPREFIFIISPLIYKNYPLIDADEIFFYKTLSETLREDFRYKLIFNFTPLKKIKRYYQKLGAFEVLTLTNLKKIASKYLPQNQLDDLPSIFRAALCQEEHKLTQN